MGKIYIVEEMVQKANDVLDVLNEHTLATMKGSTYKEDLAKINLILDKLKDIEERNGV